jgi:hypothetical protein
MYPNQYEVPLPAIDWLIDWLIISSRLFTVIVWAVPREWPCSSNTNSTPLLRKESYPILLGLCCELAPHMPEDCMDCVSGRSPPESSTLEMAMVGRRPPCTVSRNGITRLLYIYIAQSLPVDKRSSKRCPTSSECPLSFHNSLYRLLAVVEPSSLFEKLDRRSNDLQVWCPLIPRAVYELSPTVFLNPLSS